MPADTVKVDRSTRWGNPYVVGASADLGRLRTWGLEASLQDGEVVKSRAESVQRFATRIESNRHAVARIRLELAGLHLACWCPQGQPCHADVLLRIANT